MTAHEVTLNEIYKLKAENDELKKALRYKSTQVTDQTILNENRDLANENRDLREYVQSLQRRVNALSSKVKRYAEERPEIPTSVQNIDLGEESHLRTKIFTSIKNIVRWVCFHKGTRVYYLVEELSDEEYKRYCSIYESIINILYENKSQVIQEESDETD